MQDPRIRVLAGAGLSVAAFTSIEGAAAALVWWFIFAPLRQIVKKTRTIIPLIIIIAFFSLLLELGGGMGRGYFIRMMVVLLIGMWIYTEQQPGDFLGLSVWLFGRRTGFDLGLLAEMGMEALAFLQADIERIRMAERLKGMQWGLHTLVPAGLVLLHGALIRAQDTTELLAVRGFRGGGSCCPVFTPSYKDLFAGLLAACAICFAFFPVSEFFILYR
jgi:energy-coupling factor transport system permease protein